MQNIKLNNGVEMPILGIGTYLLQPREAENSVKFALQNGYELVDTANAYQNEIAVGKGIKASGKKRDGVFIETKLWPCFYEDDEAIDRTLERLGVEQIDLMILHQGAGNYIAGYKQLEKAYEAGKLRAIGISNFTPQQVEELDEKCDVVPAIIQSEFHPMWQQLELRKVLEANNIALQSWYPLGGKGNTNLLENEVVKGIAESCEKSAAQVLLRWQVQKGVVCIPGSKNTDHIASNINIFDFELTQDQMNSIDSLAKSKPIFEFSEEKLEQFAQWVPEVNKD